LAHHVEGRLQVAVHFDAGLQVEQLKQAVNAVQCHSPYCVLPHYNGAFFRLLWRHSKAFSGYAWREWRRRQTIKQFLATVRQSIRA